MTSKTTFSRKTDHARRRHSHLARSGALYAMVWDYASTQSSSEGSQRTLSLLALISWRIIFFLCFSRRIRTTGTTGREDGRTIELGWTSGRTGGLSCGRYASRILSLDAVTPAFRHELAGTDARRGRIGINALGHLTCLELGALHGQLFVCVCSLVGSPVNINCICFTTASSC